MANQCGQMSQIGSGISSIQIGLWAVEMVNLRIFDRNVSTLESQISVLNTFSTSFDPMHRH